MILSCLERKKIITGNNPKKGNQELLTLFHEITGGVEHMDSRYIEVCKELNEYSTKNPVKKWTLIKGHQLRLTVTNIVYLLINWYGILKRDHMPTERRPWEFWQQCCCFSSQSHRLSWQFLPSELIWLSFEFLSSFCVCVSCCIVNNVGLNFAFILNKHCLIYRL